MWQKGVQSYQLPQTAAPMKPKPEGSSAKMLDRKPKETVAAVMERRVSEPSSDPEGSTDDEYQPAGNEGSLS